MCPLEASLGSDKVGVGWGGSVVVVRDKILKCFGSRSVRFTFILTKTVNMLATMLLRLASTIAMMGLRTSADTR